jgi:hypothetical protein
MAVKFLAFNITALEFRSWGSAWKSRIWGWLPMIEG